jgi:Indigoidine synthase A like protein
MDISADLTELGRTHVAVISSGCKSFLDIPRTLEYLETQGVTVCTFADGRTGAIDFPAFYTRDSGSKSPMVVQDAREAAAIICKWHHHNLKPTALTNLVSQSTFSGSKKSGMLFANPVPEEFAMQKAEIDAAIDQAVQEAAEQGFHGHANTPFILSRIKDLTHGNSLPANRALIESNVAMAAKVAVELSKLKDSTNQDPEPDKEMAKRASMGQADVNLRRRKCDSNDETSNIEVNLRDRLAHSITGKAAVSTSFPVKPRQRRPKPKSNFNCASNPCTEYVLTKPAVENSRHCGLRICCDGSLLRLCTSRRRCSFPAEGLANLAPNAHIKPCRNQPIDWRCWL